LKPDKHKYWGELPGEYNIKLKTTFRLFNFSNLEAFLNNSKANLTELPPATFEEHSNMFNWSYLDDNLKDLGQDNPGDFVAYNQKTNLVPVPSDSVTVPGSAPVTSVNYLTYVTFYQLSHSPPPIYMIPTMYEVVQALENDFYVMILAYVSWKSNISDFNFTRNYLESQGFDPDQIMDDEEYSWAAWENLKPWVQSLLDLKNNGLSNSFENIQMRFQMEGLVELISEGSLLFELVMEIQSDMVKRYGSNDPKFIGDLQWATGKVTLDLPLGLGVLSIPGSIVPFPSFVMMNKTFGTVPEEYFLQLAKGVNSPLFLKNVSKLLEISYEYPRTNTGSFLYLNNLIALFNDTEKAKEIFGFDDQQVIIAQTYLGSLINFKVPEHNVTIDKYSLTLAKLAGSSFVSNTINLRNDAYWSVPTVIVFKNFSDENISCEEWVSNVNSSLKSVCSSNFGWNISTKAWWSIEIWVKAAFKGSKSLEFKTLKEVIPEPALNSLLFQNNPNISQLAQEALELTSKVYICARNICNYEELFYLQWGGSFITSGPPSDLADYINSSNTMKTWLPLKYSVPIEWSNYSPLLIYPAAFKILNYTTFLSSGVIRLFFNSYFQGNLSATAKMFKLPNEAYVEGLYNYLLKIIPGLNFFTTRSYSSWVSGYRDEFPTYMANLGIYHGGLPSVNTAMAAAANQTDKGKPRHIVRSGRLDTGETKFIYKYYNSRQIKRYRQVYDETTSDMKKWVYEDIWAEPINYTGGIGGSFGTRINNDDILSVYLQAVMRDVNLTYDKDVSYHGLTLSRFLPDKNDLKTSDKVPGNAKYFQLPHGFDGFMNISAEYGCPFFVSFSRCYQCESDALEMFDRFEYVDVGKSGKKIHPSPSDSPYAELEPLSGTGIRVRLNIELRIGFYNDYFFKNFYEPVPGKGVYFPIYILERKIALTDHQVNEFFGRFKLAQRARRNVFLGGIIGGSFFFVFAFISAVFIYKTNNYMSWGERRNTLIKHYISMAEGNDFGK
jgi:hypothetical protein